MKKRSSNLLQLPSGATGLFLQDARLHQEAVQKLNQLYALWGYLPVHTPVADYAKVYEEMIPDHDSRRVYHLVDRDGEVLMLRWDITLFLIKQIRSLVRERKAPLRVSYADSIIRHEDIEDIGRNEFFQTGIELIGKSGPDGDLEVFLLMNAAFSTLGLKPAYHLGSRRLFDLATEGLSADERDGLSKAISLRDRAEILSILGLNKQHLVDLFCLVSPVAQAEASLRDIKKNLSADLCAEIDILSDFARRARELEPDLDLHLDSSELGSQNYHSGLVFQAYLPGLSVPAGAGGRYDRLLERLDCPSPATGFSIMLSRLLPLLDTPVRLEAPEAEGGDFATRYLQARKLRAGGKEVRL